MVKFGKSAISWIMAGGNSPCDEFLAAFRKSMRGQVWRVNAMLLTDVVLAVVYWPTGSPTQVSEPLTSLVEHPLVVSTMNERCPSPHTMTKVRRRRENRASTHNTRHQRWLKLCL